MMKAESKLTQLIWLPWTLWCTFTFVLTVVLMLPLLFGVVWLGNDKVIRWAHFVPAKLSRMLLKLWLVKIDIVGREWQQPDTQVIYVSNHMSYLDAFIAGATIPNFLKYLGKAEILAWPGLGYLLKKFYVPVWRDDPEHRHRSMEQMNEKLKTGASFFICPEGTCNTTPELLKYFHKGAFRLAIHNQIPVVPLTFVGAADLFPRNGFMLRPGTITVYWSQPISIQGLTDADAAMLREQCMHIIRGNLLKHYPAGQYPQ